MMWVSREPNTYVNWHTGHFQEFVKLLYFYPIQWFIGCASKKWSRRQKGIFYSWGCLWNVTGLDHSIITETGFNFSSHSFSASLHRAWGVFAFLQATGGTQGSALDFQRAARFRISFCSFISLETISLQCSMFQAQTISLSNIWYLLGTNFCSRQLPRQQLIAENLGEKEEVDKVGQ